MVAGQHTEGQANLEWTGHTSKFPFVAVCIEPEIKSTHLSTALSLRNKKIETENDFPFSFRAKCEKKYDV